MMTALLLALAVASQAGDDAPSLPILPDDGPPAVEATAGPGLHRVRIVGPRDVWVWSVPTSRGKFLPVDYEPTPTPTPPPARPTPPRPSFETNGVVSEKLDDDGRIIRASDPATMIQAQQVIEDARRKKPDPPAKPCIPDLPDLARDVASAWLWSEMLKYYIPTGVLTLLSLLVLGLAFRLRRPS